MTQVDFRDLKPAGSYPSVEEKAALELAREIHWSRSDAVAVSWEAQEEAQNFINEHGLAKTLDRMFEIRKKRGNE